MLQRPSSRMPLYRTKAPPLRVVTPTIKNPKKGYLISARGDRDLTPARRRTPRCVPMRKLGRVGDPYSISI